ncbi:hypothetical protein ZHAS_00008649 [Anopheles sinensis]|uniref:Uncharacterized protein n=1 Tax=Anopheles sinensis TaxID=74873 RepID=A0A084VST7_ANOSI|nr:hypothetical protein ZHAS_00008649 [Anopheles sinensis]
MTEMEAAWEGAQWCGMERDATTSRPTGKGNPGGVPGLARRTAAPGGDGDETVTANYRWPPIDVAPGPGVAIPWRLPEHTMIRAIGVIPTHTHTPNPYPITPVREMQIGLDSPPFDAGDGWATSVRDFWQRRIHSSGSEMTLRHVGYSWCPRLPTRKERRRNN